METANTNQPEIIQTEEELEAAIAASLYNINKRKEKENDVQS